jgi:hypothetical protein
MITNQVVLILGAGASIPYGFPSGSTLTNQIVKELKDKGSEFTNDILDSGFEWGFLRDFCQQLDLSFQASIDAFLEHRPEFISVGKTCIARALIPCETWSNLARGRDRHWYAYMFQRLNMTPESFEHNKLSIITFNYDRSLEQFLFLAIKNSYGLSDDDAAALVRSIPIVHLHGDLGKLPEIDGSGRPYEPTISSSILKQCASDIKIIHEDVPANSQFVQAQKLIARASVICFLGFGFHPVNIKRIWVNKPDAYPKTIYGTAYQMPSSEQAVVVKRFDRESEKYKYIKEHIQLANCDALQALQQWPILV